MAVKSIQPAVRREVEGGGSEKRGGKRVFRRQNGKNDYINPVKKWKMVLIFKTNWARIDRAYRRCVGPWFILYWSSRKFRRILAISPAPALSPTAACT